MARAAVIHAVGLGEIDVEQRRVAAAAMRDPGFGQRFGLHPLEPFAEAAQAVILPRAPQHLFSPVVWRRSPSGEERNALWARFCTGAPHDVAAAREARRGATNGGFEPHLLNVATCTNVRQAL